MLRWHRHRRPAQQLRNGQNLDTRVGFAPARRMVHAGADRLGPHLACRLLQRHEHADGGFFPLHRRHQVADVARLHMTQLHLHQHPPHRVGIQDADHAVHAPVAALLAHLAALLPTLLV